MFRRADDRSRRLPIEDARDRPAPSHIGKRVHAQVVVHPQASPPDRAGLWLRVVPPGPPDRSPRKVAGQRLARGRRCAPPGWQARRVSARGLGHPGLVPLSAPALPPVSRSVPTSGPLGFAQGVGSRGQRRRAVWSARRRRWRSWSRTRRGTCIRDTAASPTGIRIGRSIRDAMFHPRPEHTSRCSCLD